MHNASTFTSAHSFMRGLLLGCCVMAGIATADDISARSCTGIADKMARLACYDAALGVKPVPNSAKSEALRDTPQTPVPPPSAPVEKKATEEAFGDTGHLRGSAKAAPPKRLTATVLDAVSLGQGLYRLTLDNGQIWQTTQADRAMDFHPSDAITISRMIAGNYLVSLTGQGRSVSIKRIQ